MALLALLLFLHLSGQFVTLAKRKACRPQSWRTRCSGRRPYAQAFDFASTVMNNNLLNERRPGRDRTVLFPITKNFTDLSDNYKLGGAICSMVNKGVLLIVGTSRDSSFNTIQSYCQALQVPYILASPSRPHLFSGYHFDISLTPPYISAVMKVLANMTSSSNKVFYVYDSDDGLWRLQQLYNYFQLEDSVPRALDAFRVRDVSRAYSLLRSLDLKDMDEGNKLIVLDLSSEESFKLVLEQIVDVGMNRDNYHYILAGPDAMDLDLSRDFFSQFLYGGVEISAFRFVDNTSDTYRKWEQLWQQYKDEYPGLFPLKTGSAMMIDAVRAVHEALMLDLPQSIRGPQTRTCDMENPQPSEVGPAIMTSLAKVQFEGLTGPLALRQGQRSEYKLDVYRLQFKRPMRKIETWHPEDLRESSFKTFEPEILIENTTQRVATLIEPPFVMKVENRNGAPPHGPNRGLEGYCIDLIEALARTDNFEYQVYLTHEYGDFNYSTGLWTGLIGQLIRKERDIAVAPLTITEERERVVDFSKPFMNTGISIMIKKPDKTKPGVFSFMDPLDTKVWLCIGLGFLAVSFVLYFVGRFSPYEWNVVEDSTERTATTIFSISNTLWFSLGALMQQGSDISPRSFSGRVIGSAWWFFTLIIISSYTANLAAFLTIEKLVVSIDSADDLVGHPTIKYGTKNSGTSWRFFKEAKMETFLKMKKEMLENADEVLFSEYPDGVRKVRESQGQYAFLLESAMNTYYGQQEPCDTMMVGEPLDNKGLRGGHLQSTILLRDSINIAVLTLKEKGELIKMHQKWWFDKGQCGDQSVSKESTGNQSALTLSNVSGIFHILIGGLVLSMITSSIEYLIQRKLRGKNKNMKNKQKAKNYTLPVPPHHQDEHVSAPALIAQRGQAQAGRMGTLVTMPLYMNNRTLMGGDPDDVKG
ncbi:glutamate receptor subunit protein GluR1 precursor [Aplysia californica]|uniref:Glutamate receptor subunit protein GluR1 n=1 Tax=Aplysia californica TaxID=6500 RepID=Q7Z1H9_APLCA|nr:glutamate receptor subunit protein GluR1 precursor [Aplysia californica]AAP41203.1 glutamate receptor subunit protein GluR1 [Aplysia californica]